MLRANRFPTFVTGLVAGVILGATMNSPILQPPAVAAPASENRVVVGLKDPITPNVIRELKMTFGSRVVNIAPGGAYALVLLRRGETLADVQARSPLIAWVEPEVVMGAPKDAEQAVVVIPSPQWTPPQAKAKVPPRKRK